MVWVKMTDFHRFFRTIPGVLVLGTHDVPHLYDLLATLVDLLGLVDGGARLVVVIFPLAALTTVLLLLGLLVILGALDL